MEDYYEEDDYCPMENCNGTLIFLAPVNCSCHINPPCSVCVNNPLVCNKCGWTEEEEKDNEN